MPNPSPRRGDIFWVNVPPHHAVGSEQYKRRPWIIISGDAVLNQRLVIALPLTSRIQKQNRQFRVLIAGSNINLESGSGMTAGDQLALTEQLRALSIDRLEYPRAARLTDTALYAVEAGVAFVLEMPQ
jgi:mRNA-degrading endonuclease toxin of MazEF toxin-antitoxin module